VIGRLKSILRRPVIFAEVVEGGNASGLANGTQAGQACAAVTRSSGSITAAGIAPTRRCARPAPHRSKDTSSQTEVRGMAPTACSCAHHNAVKRLKPAH
jgi:hypothetical protein